MGRRTLNRKELRADFDAAERRKADGEEAEETDVEEDEDEDVESAEAEEEAGDEEEEEVVAKPAKKRKAAAPKAPKAKRSRAAKVVRMKVVWGVFNNSNQRVAVYEYPKHKEALEHAAKLRTDKRSTFFVQQVKEPMEEKKEEK